jgi:tetratricopeptide (TPR) repeat protein
MSVVIVDATRVSDLAPTLALVRRAELLIGTLGRDDEAIALLSRGLATEPSAHMWCLLSLAQKKTGRPEEALASAESALMMEPEFAWAYTLRGYALMELGRIEAALESLQETVRLRPNAPNAWLGLAVVSLDVGRRDIARTAVDRALKLAPQTLNCLIVAIRVCIAEADWDAAERLARAALGVDPANATACHLLGDIHVARSQVDLAIAMYRAAVRANPQHRGHVIALTNTLVVADRYSEAIKLYREMLETARDDAQAWCGLAQSLRHTGAYQDSLTALARAVELEPQSEWAYRLRSLIHWSLGDDQQALDDARSAARFAPPGCEAALAWRFLCSTAIDMERFDEAEEALLQAGRHEGGSVRHHVHDADVAWHRSQPERARKAAADAVARDPASVDAMVAQGYAALAASDWKRARTLFTEVRRFEPTNCCARAACALAALEQGEAIEVDDVLEAVERESLNCRCRFVKLLRDRREA